MPFSWDYRAEVALEVELSPQIDLKVENESRPDIEVRQMGEYPNDVDSNVRSD